MSNYYLCDTCRLSGYDMGIYGPMSTEWECWADWEGEDKPYIKKVINGHQHPAKVCRKYKVKTDDR